MPNSQYVSNNERRIAVILAACIALYANGLPKQPSPDPIVSSSAFVAFTEDVPSKIDSHAARWAKFQVLSQEWKQERGAMSSITEMSMLPAYQKIIGMGVPAIPMIIAQLKSEGNDPDQWFWALRAISEANELNPPQITPEQQGDFMAMGKAWISWAETEGYAG